MNEPATEQHARDARQHGRAMNKPRPGVTLPDLSRWGIHRDGDAEDLAVCLAARVALDRFFENFKYPALHRPSELGELPFCRRSEPNRPARGAVLAGQAQRCGARVCAVFAQCKHGLMVAGVLQPLAAASSIRVAFDLGTHRAFPCRAVITA